MKQKRTTCKWIGATLLLIASHQANAQTQIPTLKSEGVVALSAPTEGGTMAQVGGTGTFEERAYRLLFNYQKELLDAKTTLTPERGTQLAIGYQMAMTALQISQTQRLIDITELNAPIISSRPVLAPPFRATPAQEKMMLDLRRELQKELDDTAKSSGFEYSPQFKENQERARKQKEEAAKQNPAPK